MLFASPATSSLGLALSFFAISGGVSFPLHFLAPLARCYLTGHHHSGLLWVLLLDLQKVLHQINFGCRLLMFCRTK